MNRSSGIIMPMYSLPSPYGIGTMGKAAYEFVDFLKASGQKYWQLLPLGPTDAGDSPYSSPSTFAGNPYLIDLDMLIEEGLILQSEVDKVNWGENEEKVNYGVMYTHRLNILRLAFDRFSEKNTQDDYFAFCSENSRWLESYAMYMALKQYFSMKPWMEWDEDIRMRRSEALLEYSSKLKSEIDFWYFIQYIFYKQWNLLRNYAKQQGISFIGDVPIYVALDSSDVWSEPWFFMLDEKNVPVEVSGVPPDAFTDEGQLWGNPLYNYSKMQSDGFGWWIRRIEGASKLYDVVRIDHFRGFESYWAVPYGEKTAKNGHWEKGPGMALVGVLTSWFANLEFIAEDLGICTSEVYKLLNDSGLPGMKVLQFAFDSSGTSSYLPHCCTFLSCCYTGTHDNNTIGGWVKTLSNEDLEFARDYMHITEDEGWSWGMVRCGMSTSSVLFMMQMQDLLELDEKARTNIPGIAEGNWRWRMKKGALTDEISSRLLSLTKTYRRCSIY